MERLLLGFSNFKFQMSTTFLGREREREREKRGGDGDGDGDGDDRSFSSLGFVFHIWSSRNVVNSISTL